MAKDQAELKMALANWSISPQAISSYKDVYQVKTLEGIYCLKEIDKKPRRALALEGVFEHLMKQDFAKTVKAHRTKDGRIMGQTPAGRNYILTDWLVGRKPAFRSSNQDLIGAATTLALFHQASIGFIAPPGGKLRSRLNRWPNRFSSRLRQVVALRDTLDHKPFLDNFDRAFIEYYPWILDRAQDGWCVLAISGYDHLVEKVRKSHSFCHGDVAERNFIVASTGEYCLIDFDLARRDMRVADLYKFFRDAMKKRHWDFLAAKLILDAYSEVDSLDPEELTVLYALLSYPHKMIHLLLRYYIKREGKSYGWSTRKFIEKFRELGKQQVMIDRFLEDFRKEYGIR
ncbi:MAG: CotS family spore coat protein [Firmicutes bacterium]|nr:CotS family spore coat protein [Bacillota bacterium]